MNYSTAEELKELVREYEFVVEKLEKIYKLTTMLEDDCLFEGWVCAGESVYDTLDRAEAIELLNLWREKTLAREAKLASALNITTTWLQGKNDAAINQLQTRKAKK